MVYSVKSVEGHQMNPDIMRLWFWPMDPCEAMGGLSVDETGRVMGVRVLWNGVELDIFREPDSG